MQRRALEADLYLFNLRGKLFAVVYSLFLLWQRLRQKSMSQCV